MSPEILDDLITENIRIGPYYEFSNECCNVSRQHYHVHRNAKSVNNVGPKIKKNCMSRKNSIKICENLNSTRVSVARGIIKIIQQDLGKILHRQ